MSIPKKLDEQKQPWYDKTLANKVNELIDYLQAKEEASKGELCEQCKNPLQKGICTCGKNIGSYEELKQFCPPESKGECKHNWNTNETEGEDTWYATCKKCGVKYSDLHPEYNPPEHEEASKGECNQCLVQCRECVECRKNFNPPEHEEDEVEKIINPFLEKWLPDSYPHLVDTDENDGQRLRNKIRDNFVSKEKIKRELDYRLACLDMITKAKNSYIHGAKVELEYLSESLGLGD